VSPFLLRFSVGLEEVAHLQADLQRAILEVS
jgi:cystathionine beta-lyase/cystathionine gamma-synthase